MVSTGYAWIDGTAAELLLIADHASNHVPDGIDLGIDPALLNQHIAIDLGVEPLTRALAERLDAPAILGGVSRLVIDYNREEEARGLIPHESDGRPIPGNQVLSDAERTRRLDVYFRAYHDRIAHWIAAEQPRLLVSVHSFTPELVTRPEELRPWPIGILYNEDERAARVAIDWLRAKGINAGDNQPYSGRVLNATMNRHAEANNIPYVGIEVRQDHLGDMAGISRWAEVLEALIGEVLARIA